MSGQRSKRTRIKTKLLKTAVGERKRKKETKRELRDDGLLGCQRPFLDASKILLMERCRKFGVVSASYELNGTKPHQLNDQRILSP